MVKIIHVLISIFFQILQHAFIHGAMFLQFTGRQPLDLSLAFQPRLLRFDGRVIVLIALLRIQRLLDRLFLLRIYHFLGEGFVGGVAVCFGPSIWGSLVFEVDETGCGAHSGGGFLLLVEFLDVCVELVVVLVFLFV